MHTGKGTGLLGQGGASPPVLSWSHDAFKSSQGYMLSLSLEDFPGPVTQVTIPPCAPPPPRPGASMNIWLLEPWCVSLLPVTCLLYLYCIFASASSLSYRSVRSLPASRDWAWHSG